MIRLGVIGALKMDRVRAFIMVVAMLVGATGSVRAGDGSRPRIVDGLITKPSTHSVDITLDRLEAALKQRGFVIFARLDHAAAAASVGLNMPRETVLVFGNPRLGTPNFIKYPTLAIDLPIKALVWEDADKKVWLSYNTQKYLNKAAYARHGAPIDPAQTSQIDGLFAEVTDAATK
jgi:uncharacterized protein (DUF302 family)